jgi:prepilin-type N-terminal cleavage/methylation domain-containing protein
MSARHAHRCGFTLVEMMVAMALTVFVMVILSQCFVAGLETFSGLKAIGDMQEDLRTATNMLRADLSADHFEGKRRLSDPNLRTEKIREGFFAIGQQVSPPGNYFKPVVPGYPGGPLEGIENGVPSYRIYEHWLHFTVKMRGNARDRFFSAPAPGLGNLAPNLGHQSPDVLFQESPNVLHSAWAEVAYFLLPTGSTINPQVPLPHGSAGASTLHALYRCVYVIVSDSNVANARGLEVRADGSPYVNIAGQIPAPDPGHKSVMRFLNPNDQASGHPGRSFNPHLYFQANPTNKDAPRGAALVLSNVVSFQVDILKSPSATGEFEDLGLTWVDPKTSKFWFNFPFDTAHYVDAPPLPPILGREVARYVNAPPVPPIPGGLVLTPPPPPYTITGLKIVLRIWDPKSRMTRQVTLMQDM